MNRWFRIPLVLLSTIPTTLLISTCGGGGGSAPSVVTPASVQIGPSGGSVKDASGDTLMIPANAFSAVASVSLTAISQQDLVTLLGRDVTQEGMGFLGAFSVSSGGSMYHLPASVSTPNSTNVATQTSIVLMRVVPSISGGPSMVLADAGVVGAGVIVTGTSGFPGILQDGQYALLSSAQSLQFFSGQVVDASGTGIDGAIVVPLPGGQIIAQTDPGNFVAAVPVPANITAPIAVSLATLYPAAAPTQFGFNNIMLPPPSTFPPPPKPIPIGGPVSGLGSNLAQIANVDVLDKCPTPDQFLEERIKQLLTSFGEKLTNVSSGQVSVSPTSITLTPITPTASFTLDFGAYYTEIVQKAGGPQITDLHEHLGPFKLLVDCEFASQEAASSAYAPINPIPANPYPIAGSQSHLVVGPGIWSGFTVTFPVSATFPASLPSSGQQAGTTTIGDTPGSGCVPQVSLKMSTSYTYACQNETSPPCNNGNDSSQSITVNSANDQICMSAPVQVTVSLAGTFTVAVNVTGTQTHVTNVQVCVDVGANSTCGPYGGFVVGTSNSIVVNAIVGESYSVVVPANQPAAAYCSVVSGATGMFGPSTPTAVVTCN